MGNVLTLLAAVADYNRIKVNMNVNYTLEPILELEILRYINILLVIENCIRGGK